MLDIKTASEERYSKMNFGATPAAMCNKAALQQARERMNFIDLEDKTTRTEVLDNLGVTIKDSRYEMGKSTPITVRETDVGVPTVTWNDVGGLVNVKRGLDIKAVRKNFRVICYNCADTHL